MDSNSRPNVSVSVKGDIIPEFNTTNPNSICAECLLKIEQLSEVNGWNDSTKIHNLPIRLRELAQSWHYPLDNYNY